MALRDTIARFLLGKRAMDASWYAPYADSTAVTVENATTLAPVFASLRHLVDYISTLPADFYRIEGDRRVKVGTPELIRNVDDEFGLQTWFGQAVYAIAAQGNAVGKVTQLSGWGLPTMIRWSGQWSGGDNGIPWWIDGKPVAESLVTHIPWIVPPGKRLGLSPIEHYAAIVAAGLSAQDYADLKRGGGIPPVVLRNSKREITADVASAAQSRAVTSFATGKPFVTGADWDFSAVTIPPNHAQFIETLKLSANQIAAIYGIDPREIGGSVDDSMTYNTEESRPLQRAQNARPYVTRLEAAVNRVLPGQVFMKLNMNAGVRADIKTRTDVLGAQIKDGRLSVNEARALEDLPPVAGGDFHNVPTPLAEPTQRTKEVTP